jgi:hypothetical protein
MDVTGQNRLNSLDVMSILSKMVAHLLVVVPLKTKQKLLIALYLTRRLPTPEPEAVSPCVAALSSSRLPKVVHTSTPPAARLCTPLVLYIYFEPVLCMFFLR